MCIRDVGVGMWEWFELAAAWCAWCGDRDSRVPLILDRHPQRFDVLVVMHDDLSPAVQALLGACVAPVQVLQWGMGSDHALTSGMGDTIDYFVDGDHLVPDAALAQQETSEQLVSAAGGVATA